MMFKLAHELKYYYYKNSKTENSEKEANRKYMAISIMINEIGSMIGGWIRKENL